MDKKLAYYLLKNHIKNSNAETKKITENLVNLETSEIKRYFIEKSSSGNDVMHVELKDKHKSRYSVILCENK